MAVSNHVKCDFPYDFAAISQVSLKDLSPLPTIKKPTAAKNPHSTM